MYILIHKSFVDSTVKVCAVYSKKSCLQQWRQAYDKYRRSCDIIVEGPVEPPYFGWTEYGLCPLTEPWIRENFRPLGWTKANREDLQDKIPDGIAVIMTDRPQNGGEKPMEIILSPRKTVKEILDGLKRMV